MGRLLAQFLRFGVVGVLATAIDFALMVALHELLAVPTLVASGVSFCVSLAFNYLASMRFVFRRRDDLSRRRELAAFVALSLIGLGMNQLVMWAGTTALGDSWYVATKVVATAVVTLWNFLSRRHWLDAGDKGGAGAR